MAVFFHCKASPYHRSNSGYAPNVNKCDENLCRLEVNSSRPRSSTTIPISRSEHQLSLHLDHRLQRSMTCISKLNECSVVSFPLGDCKTKLQDRTIVEHAFTLKHGKWYWINRSICMRRLLPYLIPLSVGFSSFKHDWFHRSVLVTQRKQCLVLIFWWNDSIRS